MFRIGILGSDNSHALAFAQLCNIPDENGEYLYDDVRVNAIYGKDDEPAHTKQVAKEGKIEFVAETPDEFIGKVDAVMVVYRKGSYHIPDILPFIERGYPIWIDKPISSSIEDIERLKAAYQKHKVLITGGSTIKYNYDILIAQNRIKSGFFGNIQGGFMNFPGDLSCEYEGLFFYGSHLIEMMLSIYGYDVKSIYATKVANGNISVIAKYEDFQVVLHYLAAVRESLITIYGDKNSLTTQMDISVIYKLGFDQFVNMLRTKKMPLPIDDLVKPVYILKAIYKSLEDGCEVTL